MLSNINSKCKLYIKVFILALSVFYSFGALFYGCPFTDTFFYLNSFTGGGVHRYFEGTQLLTKLWLSCFGDNILLLRIFDWIFYVLSFVLVYFWFVPQKKQNIHLLAIPLILQTTFSLNYFNADSISLLCVVCLCKCVKNWIIDAKDDFIIIFLLVIIIVFSSLVRFTNIIAVPLIVVYVIMCRKFKEMWKQTFFICTVSVLVYYTVVILLRGGIQEYLHPTVVATSCGTEHTIKSLVYYYIQDGKIFIQYFPLCMLLIIMSNFRLDNKCVNYGLWGVGVVYFLYYLKYHVQLSVACSNLSIFISAFFIAVITYMLVWDFKNSEWDANSKMLLLIGVLSMVNPAGSDSAFLKLIWLFVAFSPYILLRYFGCFNQGSAYLKVIISILLFYSVYNFYKKPMPCVPSIGELNYEIDDYRLKNIKVSKYRKDLYDNVRNDLEKYNPEQVVFYGMQAHGLYYLYNVKNVLKSDFFMYGNDVDNAVNMVEAVNQYKPLVFFMPYKKELTIVEDSLVANGYIVIDENYCYKLYNAK
ncbi:MAG: hypothetical protein MJZ78_03115 [Bacteroidales bacterium]|nr:hypothetical protein [Bacteroidales bacterium]